MPPDNRSGLSSAVQSTLEDNPNWNQEIREAYIALYAAHEGDKVRFAERKTPMTVSAAYLRDGNRVLEVEKPQADGVYEVRESWSDQGGPEFTITSEIGRATDLEIVDRGKEHRKPTETELDDLADRLSENAVDSFMRDDYPDWESSVRDVVEEWAGRVSNRQWRGYRHHPDWETGDPDAIFEAVVETFSSSVDRETAHDLSIRERAESALYEAVFARGLEDAESTIITSDRDYNDVVSQLAHHTLDRIESKSYSDAYVATRDTISDWLDDREPVVYEAILEHSEWTPESDELYVEYESPEDIRREQAFDVLSKAVWGEVQALQRDRGDHDPTLRGMTRQSYNETVDYLAAETLRRWDNDGFLRTTAKDVVSTWADSVESEEWGGHRYDTWAAGDVEDIFASAAIHSGADPFVWNPFSDNKERKMAAQAILADVVDMAEDMYDEEQPEMEPVPADEYLQDVLGVDTSYSDFKAAEPQELDEVLPRISEAATGDEVGWTFVDEILEHGGTVPEMTNDWVLVDYGVIREGETLRKLAWFDRSTGDVLVLSGRANAPPDELSETTQPYQTFHVSHQPRDVNEPEFVCEDVSLQESLECVYEFVGGTQADIRIIETKGEDYVQEQITHEDVNAGGVLDALVPNLPVGTDDIFTLADKNLRGAADYTANYWGPEMAQMAAYVAVAAGPHWVGKRLDGVKVEPNIHKKHGIGTNISKEFGKAPHESGVGGKAQVDINIRPSTFEKLGQKYAPGVLRKGLDEGDIGKGVVRDINDWMNTISSWGEYEVYEDSTINTILRSDLDSMSLEELQDLADETDRDYDAEVYHGLIDEENDEREGEELRRKLYGYANYADPEEVRRGFGGEFVDEFGESMESVIEILQRGSTDMALDQEKREYLAEYHDKDLEEVELPEDWEKLSDETQDAFYNDIVEDIEFSWDEFESQDIGISGMLMRGLDAEGLVDGAEFLNIDDWLERNFTFVGGDYFDDDDPPTFEEWKEQRFGQGKPAGPEEEARLWAQYHKEIHGTDPEDATPLDALGIDKDAAEMDEYDVRHEFDDTFGNSFEDVEERIAEGETDAAADEFERMSDEVSEG